MNVLLSEASYDIFTLDLYYHKICYLNFTCVYDPKQPTAYDVEKEKLESQVNTFFWLFEHREVKDQDVYLLIVVGRFERDKPRS